MLTDGDRRQLEEVGIEPAEAERQLSLLGNAPRYLRLERPCTIDDGIERLEPNDRPHLLEGQAAAARAGRCLKFVPASGAATRMFRDLLFFQSGAGRELCWPAIEREAKAGHAEAATLVELLARVRDLPFYERLRRTLFRRGEDLDGLARVGAFQPVLDALLDQDGMNYGALPKGQLDFHAAPGGARTAFEEHLAEAIDYLADASGTCRLHFTVSPEHRAGFERLLDDVVAKLARGAGSKFEVGWSVQKPRTDTLAVDASGAPVRDEAGRLRLRPGGHGALIENLGDLSGDVVFIKNIDNVQPERGRALTVEWKKLLCGHLLRLQHEAFEHIGRLRVADPPDGAICEAERWVAGRLHIVFDGDREPPTRETRRASLIARLNRPLRVSGVVRNTGEPGGGPFWVRAADGTTSLQIVESAQIDPDDPAQQEIFRSSTHFNPVDLVCGLRDAAGEPFRLGDFVDPDAVIVTRKSEGGRDIRVLERPGLWNGGMAAWNTVFVEVPIETFTPVKTVLDLLRPEHCTPDRSR